MILAWVINIVVLVFAAAVTWWLSGFDTRLTGDHGRGDFIQRGLRCGISLLLVEAGYWCLWRYWRYDDRISGFAYIATLLPQLILWLGCITEMAARGFHSLIDPEDHRPFDPEQSARDLDAVARLIREGRKPEAVDLCRRLKESGEASELAMNTMLERLGVPQPSARLTTPLKEAGQLRQQGRFQEAELILNSLLLDNPANVDAAMMLMRLYARDLRRTDKAHVVLRSLEQQPHVAARHIEFARRSIHEWRNPRPEKAQPKPLPESVDELVAGKHFGSAVEMLEQKLKEQPGDFDAWMKLAEVHGRYCHDPVRAGKIIQQLQRDGGFSPEQMQLAKAKLAEWQKARSHGR